MTGPKLLKKWTKLLANRLGFDVVRYTERLTQRPFNVLDFIVSHYVSLSRPFYFVQIGASDGVRWDPLHHLVCEYHLSGLLVEPLPDVFAQLKLNYEGESQLSFANCAIAPRDGVRSLFRVRSDAPVGDWAQGIASFNRAHLMALLGDVEEGNQFIEEVIVPSMTVGTLLQKHQIDRVALLQIDVEGYDYEVLKMFFVEQMFPDIINFERVHLSFSDQQKSRQLLARHEYRFIDVGIDTLAIRATLSSPLGADEVVQESGSVSLGHGSS